MNPLLAIAAGCGLIQAGAASWLFTRFARQPARPPAFQPAITVLKPLYGVEPLLEAALTSLFQQDYPAFQIVFGVQDQADPAIALVEKLRSRFPAVPAALVVDATLHGSNRKVCNLINMLPAASHDVLVIADSDVHVAPNYLQRLVAALQAPGVGLVTTLYAGLPAFRTLASRLGATQITHGFMPSAVLARSLGRNDCLGATMCLRRQDLSRIGGLAALVNHLADDQVLGRRIQAAGLQVALAQTVPLTTVPETTLGALLAHELRWARTIRALEPLSFAASVLQYPLVWALLAVLFSGAAMWSLALFVATWLLRAAAAIQIDRWLGRVTEQDAAGLSCPVWLLPLREVLSVCVMIASYGGRRVTWRGHDLRADTPQRLGAVAQLHPIEESNAR